MSAGRRLFKRDTEWETMNAVGTGPLIAPSKVRGHGDPRLDAIILRALERDPKRRFQNAADLASRLESFAADLSKSEPRRAVEQLMSRLYGAEAKEERSLLAALSSRSANANELATLRRLSGLSARPGVMREITLAGEPEGLRELDHFGEEDTEPGPREPMDENSAAATVESTVSTGSMAVQRAVQAIADENRKKRRQKDRDRARDRWWISVRRRWVPLVALGLIGGASAITVVVMLARQRPPTPAVPAPDPELTPSASALRLDPIEVSIAPPVRVERVSDLGPELDLVGLDLSASGGLLTIGDGSGGVVRVSTAARAMRLGAERGMLLLSDAAGLPAVGWLGPREEGEWSVRALSINDCPAEARGQPAGIELVYGGPAIVLPFGGGRLEDVRLTPPSFADRLEVEPLGIAFGAPRSERRAKRCSRGWGAQGVLLERLPPGSYLLLWMGGERTKTDTLRVPTVPTR
jgi:hypothetical protein